VLKRGGHGICFMPGDVHILHNSKLRYIGCSGTPYKVFGFGKVGQSVVSTFCISTILIFIILIFDNLSFDI
jgi:hypothetical protein